MAQNTRYLILDAAAAAFSQAGFAGARVQQIARSAGVNKQLIYYYFGSKRGLFEAVLDRAEGEVPGARPADRRPGLRAYLAELLASLGSVSGDLARLLADPQARTSQDSLNGIRARFTEIIANGQLNGMYRDDVDPEIAAGQITTLVLGHLLFEGSESERERQRWLSDTNQMLNRWLSW